jgi:hypothetical protein
MEWRELRWINLFFRSTERIEGRRQGRKQAKLTKNKMKTEGSMERKKERRLKKYEKSETTVIK